MFSLFVKKFSNKTRALAIGNRSSSISYNATFLIFSRSIKMEVFGVIISLVAMKHNPIPTDLHLYMYPFIHV